MSATLKINWLSYLDPRVYGGGGERVTRELLEEAGRRGHQVRISSVRWGKLSRLLGGRTRVHRNPDRWILTDLWNCPEEGRHFPESFLEAAVRSRRLVTFDNAWTTICSRAFFPCGGDPVACPDRCARDRAWQHYSAAALTVFVSPLQRKCVESVLGQRLPQALEIPPTVDKQFFHRLGYERDIPYLFVGTISDYKGAIEVEKEYGYRGLHWAGRNVTGRPLEGTHLGFLDDFALRDVYNRAETVVHLPRWVEPMGRNVIEALLCGCRVVLNEKVGAAGWGRTEGEIRALPGGASVFWDKVEGLSR